MRGVARMADVVYLAQCADGHPIKVGVSASLERRMQTLRCPGCGRRPAAIAYVCATRRDERAIHASLSRWRIHGEWYRSDALVPAVHAMNDIIDRPITVRVRSM